MADGETLFSKSVRSFAVDGFAVNVNFRVFAQAG